MDVRFFLGEYIIIVIVHLPNDFTEIVEDFPYYWLPVTQAALIDYQVDWLW